MNKRAKSVKEAGGRRIRGVQGRQSDDAITAEFMALFFSAYHKRKREYKSKEEFLLWVKRSRRERHSKARSHAGKAIYGLVFQGTGEGG